MLQQSCSKKCSYFKLELLPCDACILRFINNVKKKKFVPINFLINHLFYYLTKTKKKKKSSGEM